MAKNKKSVNNTPLDYEDKANWGTNKIEQNPDFANNPKAEVSPLTKKVVQPANYRKGDLDDYKFGDDVRMNSRGGYDWTDANGNQHSTYDVTGNRLGSYHSITDKDGNKKVYYQNGSEANSYIRALNSAAEKAWGKKLETVKNGGGTTPTSTASTITGENLKLGGDTTTSGSGKLGQPIPSSNDKDEDKKDTLETTGVSNGENTGGSNVPTKEELEEGSKTEDLVDSYGEGANFQSPYVNAKDNLSDREKLEELLAESEGKPKGIYGPTVALLNKEFGRYELPKVVQDKQGWKLKYNGKDMLYKSEEEANAAKKELTERTKDERRNAWAQYLTHLGSGLGKGAIDFLANAASWAASGQLIGDKLTGQSTWDKEINNRLEGNNKLYYDNESQKNSNIRRLVQLADEGVIKLTDLTNQEVALFISSMGKERAMQLLTSVGKNQIEKYLAMDWAKNWSQDLKNAYVSWAGSRGSGPANETFIALASGQTSLKDVANKWNTETKYSLAKDSKVLDQLDEAIKANQLTNKMTQAQVDVVKELVAEQLRAARLDNNARVKDMVTSSVDSVAKLVGAVVPF